MHFDVPTWCEFSRLWIDHRGGIHASAYTHGSTFQQVWETVMGAPPGLDASLWMQRACGSIPRDASDCYEHEGGGWEEDDNPGWQWNRWAIEQCGWIRLNAERHEGLRRAVFSCQMDSRVVSPAALAALRATVEAESRVSLSIEDGQDFFPAGPGKPAALSLVDDLLGAAMEGIDMRLRRYGIDAVGGGGNWPVALVQALHAETGWPRVGIMTATGFIERFSIRLPDGRLFDMPCRSGEEPIKDQTAYEAAYGLPGYRLVEVDSTLMQAARSCGDMRGTGKVATEAGDFVRRRLAPRLRLATCMEHSLEMAPAPG